MLLPGRSMPYAPVYSGFFFLFIVDGKFAISARQTGHTRHELAPGPKELLLSLPATFVSCPLSDILLSHSTFSVLA